MYCRLKERQYPDLQTSWCFSHFTEDKPHYLCLLPSLAVIPRWSSPRALYSSIRIKSHQQGKNRYSATLHWDTEWERVLLSWFSIRLWACNNAESTAVVVKYFNNLHKHSVCFISSIIFRQITNNNRNSIITIFALSCFIARL